MKVIILNDPMGVGKTTVGKYIAEKYTGTAFIDRDNAKQTMLNHYERIDLASFICYPYGRNGVGGGGNGKYDPSKGGR